MTGSPVLVLTAMPAELRPLVRALSLRPARAGGVAVWTGASRRTPVTAATVGIGPSRSREASRRLLVAVDPRRVLVAGVAGGIDPALAVGDVLRPRLVVDAPSGAELSPDSSPGASGILLTSPTLITGERALGDLRDRGISAVDMETAAVGAACAEHGCAWSAVRTISDLVGDGLLDESVLAVTRHDGRIDPIALARLLASRPVKLARLARQSRAALAALARAVPDELSHWP